MMETEKQKGQTRGDGKGSNEDEQDTVCFGLPHACKPL